MRVDIATITIIRAAVNLLGTCVMRSSYHTGRFSQPGVGRKAWLTVHHRASKLDPCKNIVWQHKLLTAACTATDGAMERNVATPAIVLQTQRSGDLHRTITLLSPALGIIRVRAYGARKGKLAGRIEQFLCGTFHLYHNPVKGEYSVVDVEPHMGSERLRSDLGRTFAASFIAEMVLRMEGGDSRQVHGLVEAAVTALDGSEEVERTLIQFIWRFMAVAGLQPDLTCCPCCDRPYRNDEILSFNTTLHSPCCRDCSDVDHADFPMALGPGARRYLEATTPLPFEDALHVGLSATAALRLKRYMLRYASIVSGGMLKTLGFAME